MRTMNIVHWCESLCLSFLVSIRSSCSQLVFLCATYYTMYIFYNIHIHTYKCLYLNFWASFPPGCNQWLGFGASNNRIPVPQGFPTYESSPPNNIGYLSLIFPVGGKSQQQVWVQFKTVRKEF